jgi:hypothetical protein
VVFVRDLLSVVCLSVRVDLSRRRIGPQQLVAALRVRGMSARRRSPFQRSRLRRLIATVDRFFPSGGNCYRRALVEIGMDADAAEEPFYLGLRAGGGKNSGHAWLSSEPVAPNKYDATFVL